MIRQPIHLLCLDAAAGTIVRYRKRPGLWKAARMGEAKLAAEHWAVMGTMDMWRQLESFRLTGESC